MEAFTSALANNIEAIWAVTLLGATLGKLYTLSTKKSVWRAYFMCFHADKDPGLNFRLNDPLEVLTRLTRRCRPRRGLEEQLHRGAERALRPGRSGARGGHEPGVHLGRGPPGGRRALRTPGGELTNPTMATPRPALLSVIGRDACNSTRRFRTLRLPS